MKQIKEEAKRLLEAKHGREIKIILVKFLGMKGYAIKFQFLDDEYIKSEIIKI